MNRFWKVALASVAAVGVAALGWRFARRETPRPPEAHDPSPNGDLSTSGGPGAASDLTDEQREELLEELEDQLGA
jgi:hypothetical protein